jgi:probable F420-dependent oxidoreductase
MPPSFPVWPMKLGLNVSNDERLIEGKPSHFSDFLAIVQTAEQMGFDSFWLADHLLWRPPGEEERGFWESLTFLSGLAAVTSRIQLGPLVACTAFRHPALLAKMVASLDEISQGRFILGLGAGRYKPEFQAFGYPYDHLVSRFEEALQIILPLLKEGHVDVSGKYYQARNCILRPRGPSAGRIPIWIGAKGPRMLHLTARYADAWVFTGWGKCFKADRLAGEYARLLEACQLVGRDPATLELTAITEVQFLAPGQARDPDDEGISGDAEGIARDLRAFAEAGVQHLIVIIQPEGLSGLAQFARVMELLER